MVWLETPTNPLLKIIDIKAVVDLLKSRRPDIITVVDNTFLTCYFQVSVLASVLHFFVLEKYVTAILFFSKSENYIHTFLQYTTIVHNYCTIT